MARFHCWPTIRANSTGAGCSSGCSNTSRSPWSMRDYVSCQYARQRALDRAALNRDAHRAFQHRHRERAYSARDWRDNPRLSIHLNPVRAWMRLVTTVLVGDQVALPAWVLCYPVESVLHAAALELAARKLILDLERQAPCTFGRFVFVRRRPRIRRADRNCPKPGRRGNRCFRLSRFANKGRLTSAGARRSLSARPPGGTRRAGTGAPFGPAAPISVAK